jgi:hypothetical protein
MDMPKLGPAQQQLAKLAGNWSGEEKLSPSQWDPKGGTAMGKVSNRPALDGWIVIQDYEQARGGQVTFRGHGIFSIDPVNQKPVMQWFDSMAGGPYTFTGEWKGDVLALTSAGPNGHSRCTFDVSGGGYRFAMEMSQDGKSWAEFMSGSYRKG